MLSVVGEIGGVTDAVICFTAVGIIVAMSALRPILVNRGQTACTGAVGTEINLRRGV
jgi:hypothetical protein